MEREDTQYAPTESEVREHFCEHESGTRIQKFDADGCGYYVWQCDYCDFNEVDDRP